MAAMHITPLTDAEQSERLAWLAAARAGRPLGTAFLWLPTAEIEVHVHPAERRAGVGTRLLDAVTAAAAARGMHALQTDQIPEDSPGRHFCDARGFRRVLALTYARLALALDLRVPGVAVSGYRLIHWEGTVPDHLAESFVRARPAMDDMPMDEATYLPRPWDVARLHANADAITRRGGVLCTTAAMAGGEMAGFTELVVPGSGTGDAQHYGTGVLPAHRGRGLARWMKATQIARVRYLFPALDGLLADTADSNTAMRRVNDSLGYRATHRSALYKRDLAARAES